MDVDGDGQAEWGTYGESNRALSVGEQGADGRNLRYVAPFAIPDATRQALAFGSRATLTFRIWRTADLDGRRLVITALPGDRSGTADFDRSGIEVFRDRVTAGTVQVDVTDALRATTTSTITLRFATDTAPVKGDNQRTEINISTADGSQGPSISIGAAPPPEPTNEPAPEPTNEPAPEPTNEPAPEAQPDGGLPLVWSDEFDGSSLDTNVWKPYHSTYGDGNNELQCHTPDNVRVAGGTLTITARRGTVTCPNGSVRQFSSGFLGTRETGTYFPRHARYEIRAKLPHAQGLWPGFWLRHRNGSSTAEVDVMEYFHSQVPGKSTATLHLDGRDNVSKKTVDFETPTTAPGWHTWAVDIEPVSNGERFTFYVDGTAIHTYTDTQHHWANVSHTNLWDIAVNLSVGGNWVGHPDDPLGYLRDLNRCAQGGTPPNNCTSTGIQRADFPTTTTYEVDYIRLYDLA